MSATIQYELNYQPRLCYYQLGNDLTALPAFATVLQGYSNAKIYRVTATQAAGFSGTETPGEVDNTDFEAYVSMRNLSDHKPYAVLIPAPRMDMFDYIAQSGTYRVKKAAGDIIAAAYSAFSGVTLIFEHGWLRGSGP
jgi:hypothetical protein